MTTRKNRIAKQNHLKLLPPLNKNICEVCGSDHLSGEPHNQMMLQYQHYFFMKYSRWPTWKDAMAHCDEKTKADWTIALKERNEWSE